MDEVHGELAMIPGMDKQQTLFRTRSLKQAGSPSMTVENMDHATAPQK